MKTICNGLKVIELSNVLAGPSVGMFFAELGAEVIKVENKTTGGDLTRKWKTPLEDPDSRLSSYYAAVNWGKKVRMVDLTVLAEREEVYELITEADIVISNFRAEEDKRLGMNYESLRRVNPKIILGSISAYGMNDSRPGFDLVLQAETGFMSMNGTPESGPLKMPVALIDILAAHQLKEGILLALIRRMQTGEGTHVDVSLYEAALASLANQASNYLVAGFVPGLSGSLHPNIAPYGEIIITKDHKKIALAIGTDRQFTGLCRVLDLTDLVADPRFETNIKRIANRGLLHDMLQKACSEIDSQPFLRKTSSEGVPAGLISNLQEVFSNPKAIPMILEENTEEGNIRCVSTIAFKGLPEF
jgi:crotonobetainyl-CoA:carnitine CoA-transferase CaiB-like acyl-CoA transferase